MTFNFDFSALGKKKESSTPADLFETFDQLDRKASHESLRLAQIKSFYLVSMNVNQE